MIARTVTAALRFRVLLVALSLAVVVGGLWRLGDAPREVYPEFQAPIVEIQTEALGLSAAEVEQLITAPLEADLLNGVAWVDEIHSESVLGLSSVVLKFEPDTDLYRARQAVQERLAQAHALPNVSKPPQMLQPTSSTSRTMMVALTSDRLSPLEVSQLARWTVKPRLQGVEGVANVASFGQRDRQLHVQVDPKRLAANGVTLQDVIEATGNSLWVSPLTFLEASSPGTGGYLETPNQRLGIRHVSPIQSAGDLAKVAVPNKPGKTLADVATVVEDHQQLIGDAIVNGKPGVLMVVSKSPGANTQRVSAGVSAAMATLGPALRDVTVDTDVFRPADYIADSSNNLATGAVAAFALLLLAVAAAFLRWRSILVVVATVLTSAFAAILVLLARGTQLDLMVIGGLALAVAVLVDDAVAGTERVVRRLRAEGRAGAPAHTVAAAICELRGPLAFAAVLSALPVVPAFFMDDLFGYLGRPLALSYLIAVVASTLVALTVAPALTVLLLGRGATLGGGSRVARRVEGGYGTALRRTLAAPRALLAGAALLGVCALALVPLLGRSDLAGLAERDYLIELDAPPGTSLAEMNRVAGEMATRLQATPGVREVASHAGRAVTGDQVSNVNKAQLWVGLHHGADRPAAVNAMETVAAAYPNWDADVRTYQQLALDEVNEGADGDLVVRVYGHNEQVLAEKAGELGEKLRRVDGVRNLQVETPTTEPTLQVLVDLDKAAQYGVKPGDVRRQAATLLAGIEVGALYYDQKVFEVVVFGTPEVRANPASVTNLLIDTPNRGLVPLRDLATVTQVNSPTKIEREGAFRRLDISADVSGRSRAAVAKDMRAAISSTAFPLEYRAELLGDWVESRDDRRELALFGGFAALAMLLLLQACFGSGRLGAGLFLVLPAGCLGGLLVAAVGGASFSVGEALGVLALLVLTGRAGVVTIRRMQAVQRAEDAPVALDLVARVARERFGPILLTTAITVLVFAPALVMGARPGLEVLHPMALVVAGGAPISLLVSLLAVPALYLWLGGRVTAAERDMLLFERERTAEPASNDVAPRTEAGV